IGFRSLNLLDRLVGLILVYTAFALPVTIWMLRNFVAAVPRELEEAAAIDGAGPYKVFWRILLPLVAPGLVATSVFAFVFAYNEFIFALTFLGTDTAKFTLPLYVQYFYGRNGANWGGTMAASTLFTVPVLASFPLTPRRPPRGPLAGAGRRGGGGGPVRGGRRGRARARGGVLDPAVRRPFRAGRGPGRAGRRPGRRDHIRPEHRRSGAAG